MKHGLLENVVFRSATRPHRRDNRHEFAPESPIHWAVSLTEAGVNFALYSEDGTAVELCLSNSAEPDAGQLRIPVIEQIWHVFLPVIGPGQLSC